MSIFNKLFARAKTPTAEIPTTPTGDKYDPASIARYISPDRMANALQCAESGDTSELFTIYRDAILVDSHIQAEFSKRKLAVLGKPISVIPWDKKAPADVQLAAQFDRVLSHTDNWLRSMAHLMDGALYPVSLVEKSFRVINGRYQLASLIPVPHHLIDYKSGHLQLRDTDTEGRILGTYHDADPNRYIIHRGHLMSSPDKFGGPMRAIIYWALFGWQNRDWWVQFLQKFGTPFILAKYPAGDDTQRRLARAMISAANRMCGCAVSTDTEVQIIEASKQAVDAYSLFHTIANREISKLILGQTLSAEAQPTGLGSGTANLQSDVRDDLRTMDASLLADTIRDQLITQLCIINNDPGIPPYITFGPPSDTETIIRILTSLRQSGLRPADDALPSIIDQIGFNVERDATPMPITPFNVKTFSADREDGAPRFFLC